MPTYALVALCCLLLAATPSHARAQARNENELIPGVSLTEQQRQSVDSLGIDIVQRIQVRRVAGDSTSGRFVTRERRALYAAYLDALRGILTAEQRAVFDGWYRGARSAFDSTRLARGGRPQ